MVAAELLELDHKQVPLRLDSSVILLKGFQPGAQPLVFLANRRKLAGVLRLLFRRARLGISGMGPFRLTGKPVDEIGFRIRVPDPCGQSLDLLDEELVLAMLAEHVATAVGKRDSQAGLTVRTNRLKVRGHLAHGHFPRARKLRELKQRIGSPSWWTISALDLSKKPREFQPAFILPAPACPKNRYDSSNPHRHLGGNRARESIDPRRGRMSGWTISSSVGLSATEHAIPGDDADEHRRPEDHRERLGVVDDTVVDDTIG